MGSLKQELGSLGRVITWLQARVTINTVAGFTQTTCVAHGFSDPIISLYGYQRGLPARSAIEVQALPLDSPVIVEALVEIEQDGTNSNRI